MTVYKRRRKLTTPGGGGGGGGVITGPVIPEVPIGPVASGSATTFTPTVVAITATEIQNLHRGLFNWQGQELAPQPAASRDYYERDAISWRMLEPTLGNYDLSHIEAECVAMAAIKGTYGFRIALMGMPGNVVPDYIQTGSYGGFGSGSSYTPNVNNSAFLARWEALWTKIGQVYGNDPRIGLMDLGGYGMYGEWHLYGAPGGTQAGVLASLNRIIDAQMNALPKAMWVVLPGNNDGDVPAAVAHALTRTTSAGYYAGIRVDSLGHVTQFSNTIQDSYWYQAGSVMPTQWQRAPVVGEIANLHPNGTGYDPPNAADWGLALQQVQSFHLSLVGNGNTGSGEAFSAFTTADQANWLNAGKYSGFRLELRNLTIPGTIERGSHFTVTSSWINTGRAPLYRTRIPQLLFKSGTTVVVTKQSTAVLRGLLPASSPTTVTDVFNMPSSVAAGTYSVSMQLIDPDGYADPVTLAITGRGTDGSYPLGNVTVPT